VVVDEQQAEGLRELICGALVAHAAAIRSAA
jgi:hypothetical protein